MRNKLIRPRLSPDQILTRDVSDPKKFLRGEWIITNGLGGYSSSSIVGITSRKYHGLLVAALPVPFGRMVMLNNLKEEIIVHEKIFQLNCEEKENGLDLDSLKYLVDFYLEDGIPIWRYNLDGVIIEKVIFMTQRSNTVYINYRLVEGVDSIKLKLSPAIHFRPHESSVGKSLDKYAIKILENKYEISIRDFMPLRMFPYGDPKALLYLENKLLKNVFYRTESLRGYEAVGDLWSPGYFLIELKKDQEGGVVASTEEWSRIHAMTPAEAKNAEFLRKKLLLYGAQPIDTFSAELTLAAEQFLIIPEGRVEDTVRARAAGEEVRTIIAGYHWFTDWGRDTMITLEGITLCTRRFNEARWIIKTFLHYIKNGLIPNMFPEGEHEGLYHTADATLWYFHAIERYIAYTQDTLILEEVLPSLYDIINYHIKGTSFGIGMDPQDQLIKQGAPGYQLTWMDAKVGDWVVTPRRGKSVEINALWYNALKLMEEWVEPDLKSLYSKLSAQVYDSFNREFWYAEKEYLYDYIDDKEKNSAFRPNQLFAIALKHPVLDPKRWESVLQKCNEKLLTPYGLRSLERDHPEYKPHYEGDLRSRDAAYHQGTVWPWLIGPFIDAWIKVYPEDRKGARRFLEHFELHLGDAGIGTISEICDAESPFVPHGCISQAWSVAEILRTWIKTA